MNNIRAELVKWDALRRQIEDMDGIDEQTILDTLEGETNLTDALLSIADEIQEREAQVEGINSFINKLRDRQKRIEGTTDTLRKAIFSAMDRARLPKVVGERCTLSLRAVPTSLTVIDETQIPPDYFKEPKPQLDRSLVLKALKDGYDIPGCVLSNGGQSLTIRVK